MTAERLSPREDELQRSVDLYAQNHRLELNAAGDDECLDCDWAGCMLTLLPETCEGRS